MRTLKNRTKLKVLALGMAGLLLAPQTALAGEIRTYTGVEPLIPIYGMQSFGPWNLANIDGNTIIINYTSGTNPEYVFGAYSNADVSNNKVFINGSSAELGFVWGGWSESGNATGNSVTINDSSAKVTRVWGGQSGDGNAIGNSVTINGGTMYHGVWGGQSEGGDAIGNRVIINGGTIKDLVWGGEAVNGSATGNSVTINGGYVDYVVFGGVSKSDAIGNNITVNGGDVTHDIFGGRSLGSATGNTVTISGGWVGEDVYGGSGNIDATGNTVTISGGSVVGDIYGGEALNGSATHNSVTLSGGSVSGDIYGGRGFGVGNIWTGNTLNVKSAGMSANGVKNFQYYNFYLPATLANSGTMLGVTTTADLTNSTVDVGFAGNTSLRLGDQVILLHTGGLTAPNINTRASGLAGIARLYDFDMSTNANNLYATVSGIRHNSQVKALSEGQASSVAFLGLGSDLLSGQGLQNAYRATSGTGGQTTSFAAMGGHSLRYETGSHVDVNGFSLLVGAARQKETAAGTRLGGLFLETGRGNYSIYNQFADRPSVRGDGNTRYYGAGWLGRSQKNDGQYTEGSLRVGRVRNKFHSGDFGANVAAYDVSAPYYGLHIGVGKETSLDVGRKLDIYTKLLWTCQNGSSATVAGDRFDFASVNSLRWQAGAKLSRKVNEQTTLRAGLAYQYEFGGKANATVNGSAIEAPSLKGGTGIVELGMTQESKDGKGASLDFSLQGLSGKARGVAGNFRATWNF